jgi:hypothetical protein
MISLIFASVLIQDLIQDPGGFIRTINRTDGVAITQTATFKLVAPNMPDLWLVGVAHIGSKQYYTDIQSILDAQDVVFYEGVRSKLKPSAIPKINPNGPKPIYQVLSDAIGLDFQLVDIHYDRPNWVNSDLTLEQLDALNKKSGKGKSTAFDMIEQILDPNSEQAKVTTQMINSLPASAKDALKIFLIEKLVKIDSMLISITDRATMDVVLTARNQSVEKVFDTALAGPGHPKSVAVFYGAAHMPELRSAFAAKYGYKTAEQRWITMAKVDPRKLDAAGKQFLGILEQSAKAQELSPSKL